MVCKTIMNRFAHRRPAPSAGGEFFRQMRTDAPRRGFALVESVVGLALVTMMMGCVFGLNAQLLRLLKDGKESAHATQLLQERAEQLRGSLWDQVTQPERLKTLAQGAPSTLVNLRGATEKIVVEPLDGAGTVKAQCDRSESGAVTASGVSLSSYQSVKITLQVKWNSRRGIRERGMVTFMTNGGI
jgi:hypothetical protein